jgi:hypothetical protein
VKLPHYRIYMVDRDGHIRRGFDLECVTDDQALIAATGDLPEGVQAEVWQGTRRVGIIGERLAARG